MATITFNPDRFNDRLFVQEVLNRYAGAHASSAPAPRIWYAQVKQRAKTSWAFVTKAYDAFGDRPFTLDQLAKAAGWTLKQCHGLRATLGRPARALGNHYPICTSIRTKPATFQLAPQLIDFLATEN
jgi:hypothetical protein